MIIGKLTYHSVLTPIHLQRMPPHTQPVKGPALVPAFLLSSARLVALNTGDKKCSTFVITQTYGLYRGQ